MCQPRAPKDEDDDVLPQPLQFVHVGKGGTVESLSTVRSHVMKGHHQKSREVKKAYLKRAKQPRRLLQLRPPPPLEEEKKKEKDATKDDLASSLTRGNELPLAAAVPYQANLIPYAWYEKSGPVLYVNRSKWPFPSPFRVTASDRIDDGRSVTPRQSHWMPHIKSPDYAPVKGAVLDPAVLAWIGGSEECWRFRVESLRWIQGRLEDPKSATSDVTIGAIMTFSMWTAGYRNADEMSSHMDAIERIVNLRGGFRCLQKDGDWALTAKLVIFDYTISVLTGRAPRFPSVEYFVNRPVTSTTCHHFSAHESPLSATGNFEGLIKYRKGQKAIITCLKEMWFLTQQFSSRRHDPHHVTPHLTSHLKSEETEETEPIPFIGEPKQPFKTHLLTLPLLSTCHKTCHNHVLDTIQNAAVIFEHSLQIRPKHFHDGSNEMAFGELFGAFSKCCDDEFWVRFPGVLLWVLLVGTAGARGREEAAFWTFYLSRSVNFSDAEDWLAISGAIKKFMEIQKYLREVA